MQIPNQMPAAYRHAGDPLYLSAEITSALRPQGLLDGIGGIGGIIKGAKCAACCQGKSGFLACVARCIATGQACDGGIDNCSGC
jgi:hypothetical protein